MVITDISGATFSGSANSTIPRITSHACRITVMLQFNSTMIFDPSIVKDRSRRCKGEPGLKRRRRSQRFALAKSFGLGWCVLGACVWVKKGFRTLATE